MAVDAPDVSVLLCTHNRRDRVLRACAALAGQRFARGQAQANDTPEPVPRYEVIVVDNASTDGTAEAVQEFARGAPVPFRYLYEPQLGKVHALNAGLVAAPGRIVAFTDDDCEPRPGWLAALVEPFADPRVGIVAGPVFGHFPEEVEQDPERRFLAHKFLGDFTLGEKRRELRGRESPLGCNMAALTEVARAVGGFSPRFGPAGDSPGVYDDSDFAWRIAAAGYTMVYAPTAIVDHYPDTVRLTRERLRSRAFAAGRCAYLAKQRGPVGIPRRCVRTALYSLEVALKALRWALTFSRRRRFVAEYRLRCAAGKVVGVWER